MALTSVPDTSASTARAREPATPDKPRLSLDATMPPGTGLNGGWWPYSRDAGAELPGLIAELNTRAGRVSRVALQADAFADIPHLLLAGGRKVHVAWFRYMNTHTVSLTMAAGYRLTLLVVPPQAGQAAGAAALSRAASGRHAGSPEAILTDAGIPAGADSPRADHQNGVR
jgi:hypothetical protein